MQRITAPTDSGTGCPLRRQNARTRPGMSPSGVNSGASGSMKLRSGSAASASCSSSAYEYSCPSRRHWRRLSRALVSKDGYRGLASSTGTMFEYLMPELFLPLCRDSLLWESARFCLYVQRRDRAGGGLWGQSESAFFSLDPSLSYRYKAHGCQSLALRRGMGADMVVSPYSSFLALAVEPRAAVRNLRRL